MRIGRLLPCVFGIAACVPIGETRRDERPSAGDSAESAAVPGDIAISPHNLIANATISYNPQSPDLREITGKYWKDPEHKVEAAFRAKVVLYPELQKKLLTMPQFEPREPNTLP